MTLIILMINIFNATVSYNCNHVESEDKLSNILVWPNVFRGQDSRTGLADWTHALSWKQFLNNNPGIIHLLQH